MVSATYRGNNHEAGSLRSDSGTEHADDSLDGLVAVLTGHFSSLALCEGSVLVHGDCFEGLKFREVWAAGQRSRLTKKNGRLAGEIHSVKNYV